MIALADARRRRRRALDVRVLRLARLRRHLRSGRRRDDAEHAAVRRQYRSPPIRCATPATPRCCEAEPTLAYRRADRRLGRRRVSRRCARFAEPAIALAHPPADADRRRRPGPIVCRRRRSKSSRAGCAPAASGGARRRARDADGAGPLPRRSSGRRSTPSCRARRSYSISVTRSAASSPASCTRRSPAATMRPPLTALPPSQVVMMPPAPSMIGISASDVVGLELGLDDEIDMAGREHAIGVAVAAVARQPHRALRRG